MADPVLDPELGAVLIFVIVGVVAVFVGLIIFRLSRVTPAIAEKNPGKLRSFVTAYSVEATLETIVRFAQQSGYKVAVLEESRGRVVLERDVSPFSWGYFFPVFVSREADGSTLVEVGVTPKMRYFGLYETGEQIRVLDGIRAALSTER